MTLDRLSAAVADPATPEWLRTGFLLWVRCNGSQRLERYLGLPASPRAFAIATRDYWLRKARSHCGSHRELATIVAANAFRFPIWAARGQVPSTAAPVLVAAFNAWEAAPLPASMKQLKRILRGTPKAVSSVQDGAVG